MSNNQTKWHCADCLWCMANKEKHECHFYAPQITSGSGTGWSNQNWPFIGIDDYCSEWKPRGDA